MSYHVHNLQPGDTLMLGTEGEYLDEGDYREWRVVSCEEWASCCDRWRLVMEATSDPTVKFDQIVSGSLSLCMTKGETTPWAELPPGTVRDLCDALARGDYSGAHLGEELKVEDLDAVMTVVTFGKPLTRRQRASRWMRHTLHQIWEAIR